MTILSLLPESIRSPLRSFVETIWIKSIKSAVSEQGLKDLYLKLEEIVPDISDQYSSFKINTEHLRITVRALHAFQISLVESVLDGIEDPVIVDIGDSAGTHLQYINGLHGEGEQKKVRSLSVNLDEAAVQRIKEKGLEAVHARADELQSYDIDPDIFLCFETLEHIMDPAAFLHDLSSKTRAKYLIITVPYVKRSRVGLHHIRNSSLDGQVNAENTHIFELSPGDWQLMAQHSGWSVVKDTIYLQYPRARFWRIAKPMWKKFDFEGFYGLILKRDDTWSSRYEGW